MSDESRERLVRWRLVLGEGAEDALGCTLDGPAAEQDRALGYLYDREYGAGRNVRPGGGQGGGLGDSQLTVPDWINAVHTLFPRRTIERIEKDALERYRLDEMVTNPDLLRRARPSMTLLKAVLHTKHLMNQQVLALARDMVRKVVEELMEKLARPVEAAFLGAVRPPAPEPPEGREELRRRDDHPPQPGPLQSEDQTTLDRDAVLLLPHPSTGRPLAGHHPGRRVGQHGRQRHPCGRHRGDLLRHQGDADASLPLRHQHRGRDRSMS